MVRTIPFVVGIIPLYLLFILFLTSWYLVMTKLYTNNLLVEGIVVAYLFPVAFILTAFASKLKFLPKISHFLILIILGIIFFAISNYLPGNFSEIISAESIVGISFISGVMSIMLYPAVELEKYFEYKKILFIAGVIFMPLFISIAAILISPMPPLSKAILLLIDFIGFWISAAWLSSRKTQGVYVPGLEFAPLLAFRPDLILPAGVNLVKGIIMIGIGLMIMFQMTLPFPPPFWNWWGFVVAFWGIIIIIPIRGIFKMFLRRARLLGEKYPYTNQIVFVRETLLFFGLLILLYGFINAFMGAIPFTALTPKPQMISAGVTMIAASYAILLIRGFYKSRFFEGTERFRHLFAKQIPLFITILLLIYGFVTMFMGKFLIPQPNTNPIGFLIGSILFTGGAALILLFRPFALKNEWEATTRIMVGMLSDLNEEKRIELITKRLVCLAGMPDYQRREQMRLMIRERDKLPTEKRQAVASTMMHCLTTLKEVKRKKLMKTVDEITFG